MNRKLHLLMLVLASAALAWAADDSKAITPVEPRFKWVQDERGIPLERDPMTPVGFVWPLPMKDTNGAPVQVVRTKRELVLIVEFISIGPKERFAKVDGMTAFLEVGREYSFTSKGATVTFKVERIEINKLVVDYEGEILEFSPKTIPSQLKGNEF
jgi:hypothetical protein